MWWHSSTATEKKKRILDFAFWCVNHMTDSPAASHKNIFRCEIPANDTKVCFISLPCSPLAVCSKGSDTKKVVSPLTKLFILFLSVGNNKTLNPGWAPEPYAPWSLSLLCLILPEAALGLGFCFLSHFCAAMLLGMAIVEWWWAEDNFNWLLVKQRVPPVKGGRLEHSYPASLMICPRKGPAGCDSINSIHKKSLNSVFILLFTKHNNFFQGNW